MTDNKLEIVYQPLEDLTPHPNNPRIHPADQVESLAAAIIEQGFNTVIKVTEDGVILAGHCRAEAAALAELEEVPTIIIPGLTELQQEKYMITDNQMASQATDDPEILWPLIEKLIDEGEDMTSTGMTDQDIEDLADEFARQFGEDTSKAAKTITEKPPKVNKFTTTVSQKMLAFINGVVADCQEKHDFESTGEALYQICKDWKLKN